ncbi:MAG TPA: CAP domain-containing protein [Kofleriaceae bacterium]|jgi:hypothetical protein
MRWTLAIVLVLTACGGGNGNGDGGSSGGDDDDTPDAMGGSGEPAGLVGITLAHNQARLAVDTTPPLPQLTWDPDLAASAAAYAAMCIDTDGDGLMDHNPNRSDGFPDYVGENIYASSGTASPTDAVSDWVSEQADYDYDTNTCSGVCGHYTQVVWRDTTKLGCALQNCAGFTYPSTILCDYEPGGNIGNEKPY